MPKQLKHFKKVCYNRTMFKNTHIQDLRQGDLVIVDGEQRTIGRDALKRDSFTGLTLWGDSYRLGTRLVPKWHQPVYAKFVGPVKPTKMYLDFLRRRQE
jgi:hypothetical protein